MVKKILFATTLLTLSTELLAARGIVIALEAPLFEKEDTKSRIVQYIRKGEEIFIHDRHAGISPLNPDYGQIGEIPANDFYLVQDKNGNEAYIQRKYIKRLYKDEREFAENISPFKNDPTDYRLKEPLPPKYPKLTDERYRAIANLALGPASKVNYPYPSTVKNENFAPRKGLELSYLKNVEFDTINRFYFGAKFHFWQDTSSFVLEGDANLPDKSATELHGQFGLGPFVTYDAYRDDDYRLCFTGGFSFNWNRTLATIEGEGEEENRIFSAYTITPNIGTLLELPHVIPSVDVVLGTSLQFHLPYTLEAQGPAVNEGSWNEEDDRITYPLGGNFTVFLGIQTVY